MRMIDKRSWLAPLALVALPAPVLAADAAEPRSAVAEAEQAVRLSAAEGLAMRLIPPGTYKKMMADMTDVMAGSLMQSIMGMTPEQMGVPDDGSGAAQVPMDQFMAERDPAFRERMDITTRVIFTEMGDIMDAVEPDVRAAIARTMARRFDTAQLADLTVFFATPTGTAFGEQFMALFTDKEMMDASMAMVPKVMDAMPAIMAKVNDATAHLPPPPGADQGAGPPPRIAS